MGSEIGAVEGDDAREKLEGLGPGEDARLSIDGKVVEVRILTQSCPDLLPFERQSVARA